MKVMQDTVLDSLRQISVSDLSVDVLPALANKLELSEGNRTPTHIEAKLNELAAKIDKMIDTGNSEPLAEAVTLTEKAEGILDLIAGNTQEQTVEVVNFKPWEQLELSRDTNNNFKLNFDSAEIDTDVLQQALIDKGVKLFLSDSFKTALAQGVKGELVVVPGADNKCNQADTGRILEENGLSTSNEPKAELLTTMLVYYLKDLSGLELSPDERELLSLFDNRESSELSFVRSGSSSFGVRVHGGGSVGSVDDFRRYNRGLVAGRPLIAYYLLCK